jgi:hypothetical protein
MLERSGGKLSCCVLRGATRSNAGGLLGGSGPNLNNNNFLNIHFVYLKLLIAIAKNLGW